MTRISGDQWIFPDGRTVVVQPGEIVEGAKLYNGYDYKNQFWVQNGKLIHHALCGKKEDRFGRPWNGPCNVCEYLCKSNIKNIEVDGGTISLKKYVLKLSSYADSPIIKKEVL